ncbi:IGF-like family receptor 1 [Brienomyrus brachyistius]|uniref:IGF-like family receptor 1 n=1 Tax=Brienomyrus brachyistius TaxID=42636 RepID=UPI0020B3F25A|nr:IGF-like family receptor 1 [Brienomyrus brachyistius]
MSLKEFLLIFFVVSFVRSTSERTSFSNRCTDDLETFWQKDENACRRCDEVFTLPPGHAFSPNCGMDDAGGQHVPIYVACTDGTYYDGSTSKCQPCTICPSNQKTWMPCNATMDTQCYEMGGTTTSGETHQVTTQDPQCSGTEQLDQTKRSESPSNITDMLNPSPMVWIVLSVTLLLCLISIYLFCSMKRKRGGLHVSNTGVLGKKQYIEVRSLETMISANDIRYLPPHKKKQLSDILAPGINGAPLWTVLDNLDVLEELIMLLDPECTAAKTTRHVAAQCSFSATWINYIYSMRDTKSPFKTVLERITTEFPEWTVGDLAKLFAGIGRGDAVTVLAKLPEWKAV